MEIWKAIPGYENYQASNMGRVRSFFQKSRFLNFSKPNILKPVLQQNGYSHIGLSNSYGFKQYKLSRIIMATFVGKSKLQVNHKNGIKTDDRLCNLEYCTPSENIVHAYKKGLSKNGEKSGKNKLTEKQAIKIKYIENGSLDFLAKKYKIDRTQIWNIKNNKSWKHI